MTSSPADLMRRNLLEVFNEPDPARRAAVIAVTYTEDVVWHEPDRIIRGRKESNAAPKSCVPKTRTGPSDLSGPRRSSTTSATSASSTDLPTNRR